MTVLVDWPDDQPLPPAAQANVSVDDVTLLDASSVTFASAVVGDLHTDAPLAVELDTAEPDPSRVYTVRVHVRVSGSSDPQVQPGDLITTRAYPVLTKGAPADVRVQLTRV